MESSCASGNEVKGYADVREGGKRVLKTGCVKRMSKTPNQQEMSTMSETRIRPLAHVLRPNDKNEMEQNNCWHLVIKKKQIACNKYDQVIGTPFCIMVYRLEGIHGKAKP